MIAQERKASADVRRAGSKFVHTVYDYDGEAVAVRRSERQYAFAICRRIRRFDDGRASVEAVRWSDSSRCKSSEFALAVKPL